MSKNVCVKVGCTVRLQVGSQLFNRNYATVLYSYNEPVAVYSKMQVFLLPMHDYSATTVKHLHGFIREFCEFCRDYPISKIHEIADNSSLENGEYLYANLIYIKDDYI